MRKKANTMRKKVVKKIHGIKYEITFYDPKLDGPMELVPKKGKKAKRIKLKKGAPLYRKIN